MLYLFSISKYLYWFNTTFFLTCVNVPRLVLELSGLLGYMRLQSALIPILSNFNESHLHILKEKYWLLFPFAIQKKT